MARGRKPKTPKRPTKLERAVRLREKILRLASDLVADGFANLVQPPEPVKMVGQPIKDNKTDGLIAHVEEALGTYIQRVSVKDNISQRPPFDHVEDSIYRRLIKDFIYPGAAMPESKVAALNKENDILESLNTEDIRYSVIDGLQRLYCYCIALLLVWKREELIEDGCISEETWGEFKECVGKTGQAREATEHLLERIIRYEIFYKIDLGGLLHYMVTFNTGQRRMSLPIQLEIMRRPLIDGLAKNGKMEIWHEMDKMPGKQKPKDQFAAAELILAAEALLTGSSTVSASTEAESFLDNNQSYLENKGDISDVVKALKRITTEIHPEVLKVYAENQDDRTILSAGGTFLLGLAAACGYVRNRGNMKILDGALDKLLAELRKPVDDPFKLGKYREALKRITTSRGKTIRRLVNDTFLRFFNGATTTLEWMDTADQILGRSE